MATRDRTAAAKRGDRQALQDRRMHAAELFSQGVHQAEVARRLGVSRQTASRWTADAAVGLRSLGPPGRRPKLAAEQLQAVEAALLQGAMAHGIDNELWTLGRIATVIQRTTGVRHHPAHVWKLLRGQLGWSLQRPARRARERDEEAIRTWAAED